METFFAVLLALVPGLFWTWYYLRKDTHKPEPLKLIGTVFFWGAIATIPAIAIEFAIDTVFPYSASETFGAIFFSALFVVAPVEEIIKYLVIREAIIRHPAFDEPIDAVIYAVVGALGFATFENILVALTEGQESVLLRFATATLLHALATGIVGYHLGMSRVHPTRTRGWVTQGVVIAILLHALYNIIASTNTAATFWLIGGLLLSMFLLLQKGMNDLRKLSTGAPERLTNNA